MLGLPLSPSHQNMYSHALYVSYTSPTCHTRNCFPSRSPGSRPGPKAGAKPLRHPGIPVFSFIDVIYHVDCFMNVEPPLNPRYKSHLVNNHFNVLLDPTGYYLGENFCIHAHQGFWSIILLYGGVFGFGIRLIVAS